MAGLLTISLWIYLISAVFPVYVPEIPKHCEKTNVCEEISNYPKHLVNNVIKKLDRKNYVLEVDSSENTKSKSEPKEYSLCKSRKMIVYPKAARNKDTQEWQFLVNQESNPVQAYEVEVCADDAEDQACGNGVEVRFNSGYKSQCKQKFMLRYMVGLDSAGNVTDIVVALPSCCACVARVTSTTKGFMDDNDENSIHFEDV